MKIDVKRVLNDEGVTLSKIYVDGEFTCFGLEDPLREKKVYSETAIPDGDYTVGTRWSPKFSSKFNHEMLWIKNVPNFEYILIHWGNTTEDTSGCLLVGNRLGIVGNKIAVLNSVSTYQNFHRKVFESAKLGNLTIKFKTID